MSAFFASTIKYLLIATVVFGVNAILVALQRHNARSRDGWHYLTPGPMMWVAVVLGAAMTGLFCYIYFFVGSARADAETQMKWLLTLIIVFDLVTISCAYAIIADQVRWNDTCIERRTLLFQIRRMSWHELATCGIERSTGYWWISSYDGPRIRFSPYYNGFLQLLRKIAEQLPKDPPAAADIAEEMEAAFARA